MKLIALRNNRISLRLLTFPCVFFFAPPLHFLIASNHYSSRNSDDSRLLGRLDHDSSDFRSKLRDPRCLSPSSFVHQSTRRADSSTETTTFGCIAQVDVANRGQRAATFTYHALLNQMRQTQVLIDVPIAATMLMLHVAPLPTIPPFVVGCGAKQHRFWRRWTDTVSSNATARSSLVQPPFTE